MTTDDLLNSGLSFVIRSPRSTLVEPPTWWTAKLNEKWVIEAYDHGKREMFLGSGMTQEEAMEDLAQGLDPKRQIDLGSVDLLKP